MKIVQLGANGRTGREVMRLALEAGDTVTALVRSADSLSDMQHDRLKVHVGDVCDPEFLKTVFPGHDAVISTLGPRTPTKSACRIYPESAEAIVEAMQAGGLKRVLITSTALLFPPSRILDHVVRLIARNNFKAAGLMEERIRSADLDWTIARTGFLTDDDERGYIKAAGAMPDGGGSISRLALAEFLVTELKQSDHVGDVVGLCGVKKARAE
jgi:uncharacterized protein YbjT (DUF2867 family)